MKAKANGVRVAINLDGLPEVTLTLTTRPEHDINEILCVVAQGKELDVEIKQHRKKRSLDSNAYAWLLIGKMADVLKTSKETLYIQMLREYGQREKELISVVSDAVGVVTKALNGHCTEVGVGTVNGKQFTHVAILRGSSTYDTKEMSIFIDGIVYEAKELGIETMTPKELSILKEKWR